MAIARLVWMGGAATVVAGGLAYGWIEYQASVEKSDARERVVRSLKSELAVPEVDRESADLALRQSEQFVDTYGADGELIRANAELLLRLGRVQKAWDAIGPAAMDVAPSPDDLELGSRVAARRYALTGGADDGINALELARAHYDRSGSAESLERAWTMAYRCSDLPAFLELSTEAAESSDVGMRQIFQLLQRPLTEHLLERSGVSGSGEPAASAPRQHQELLEWVQGERAIPEPALSDLDGALREMAAGDRGPSPEFRVVRAEALLGQENASVEDLEDALFEAEQALSECPSSVEARHLVALVLLALEREPSKARGHIGWLLANGAAEDRRRGLWQQMRDALGDGR